MRAVAESLGIGSAEAGTVTSVIDWYIAQGITIVPCRVQEKLPSIEWRGVSETGKRLGHQETYALFDRSARVEDWNYAVICGKASGGLVIIDWDDKERGLENPVDTFTVATGKGLHYYVRVLDGPGQRNRSFPRARLDIRGQGGIAIAPPSQHPSGAMYAVGSNKRILVVTDAWFNDYLARALARYGETSSRKANPEGWFTEAFTQTCPEGGRNNLITKMAGYLIRHLPPDVVENILALWAEERCDPPVPREEVARVIDSLDRKERFNEVQAKHSPQALDGGRGFFTG